MKKVIGIVLSCIDVQVKLKEPAHRIIDEVLEPALDKMVADSSNPYDDMAKQALYPVLEQKVKEVIDEKLGAVEDLIKAKIDELKALAS